MSRTKERDQIQHRSPRALNLRRSKKRVFRFTFRAFRDVWVVLRHGGGAFFFVRVLPFLCKERESVSMSAPKAQTSRFEREIRRERERERDDDDDDDVSSKLLCF